MKRALLTISLISIMVIGVRAQSISGGIKAGFNVANQNISYGSISLNTKSKIGFHGGGYVTVMFTEKIGLQPELLFSTQGSKAKEFDYGFNVNYVIIPVLVRYNITEMVSVHAGPQLGFLTSAKFVEDSDSFDEKDEFKGIDFSVAFGVGIDLPMGLNFGMRYIIGLSNVTEDEEDYGTFKNTNFQLFVGYRLFGE